RLAIPIRTSSRREAIPASSPGSRSRSSRPSRLAFPVMRVLVTGMSGTGKSSALAELRKRGFRGVDTDDPGWTEWSDEETGYVWREDRIAELLARDREATLYVSGTVSNQGSFYPHFDAVVLLSAPADVLFDRIESRTTNDYGKTAGERDLILEHLAEV